MPGVRDQAAARPAGRPPPLRGSAGIPGCRRTSETSNWSRSRSFRRPPWRSRLRASAAEKRFSPVASVPGYAVAISPVRSKSSGSQGSSNHARSCSASMAAMRSPASRSRAALASTAMRAPSPAASIAASIRARSTSRRRAGDLHLENAEPLRDAGPDFLRSQRLDRVVRPVMPARSVYLHRSFGLTPVEAVGKQAPERHARRLRRRIPERGVENAHGRRTFAMSARLLVAHQDRPGAHRIDQTRLRVGDLRFPRRFQAGNEPLAQQPAVSVATDGVERVADHRRTAESAGRCEPPQRSPSSRRTRSSALDIVAATGMVVSLISRMRMRWTVPEPAATMPQPPDKGGTAVGKLRHIAMQVPDLEKAAAFYEEVFELDRGCRRRKARSAMPSCCPTG